MPKLTVFLAVSFLQGFIFVWVASQAVAQPPSRRSLHEVEDARTDEQRNQQRLTPQQRAAPPSTQQEHSAGAEPVPPCEIKPQPARSYARLECPGFEGEIDRVFVTLPSGRKLQLDLAIDSEGTLIRLPEAVPTGKHPFQLYTNQEEDWDDYIRVKRLGTPDSTD